MKGHGKGQPRGVSVEETMRQRERERAHGQLAERFKAVGLLPDEVSLEHVEGFKPRLSRVCVYDGDARKVLAVFEAVSRLLPVMTSTDMDCLRVVDELRSVFNGEKAQA